MIKFHFIIFFYLCYLSLLGQEFSYEFNTGVGIRYAWGFREIKARYAPTPGFMGGVSLNYLSKSNTSWQVQLNFENKGYRFKGYPFYPLTSSQNTEENTIEIHSYNYLSLHILYKVKLCCSNKVHLIFGPYTSYLLNKYIIKASETQVSRTKVTKESDRFLRYYDLGVTGGINFSFQLIEKLKWKTGAQMSFGLLPVRKNLGNDVRSLLPPTRTFLFTIYLGIGF